MRRSSCSTTPIWMRRCRAPSPASIATPARPACAPTGCWCRTACTTRSRRSSPTRWASCAWATACAGVTDQGPLIDAKAVAKVEEHIADAVAQGRQRRRWAASGTRWAARSSSPPSSPSVTPEMLVAREETFGPVAPLFKFKTEAEAIAMANDTEFGLAAYFYTRDLARSWRVSEAIEYGIVGSEHRHHLHRGGALRRRQGIRHRPRRLEVRHPRLHRDQVRVRRRSELKTHVLGRFLEFSLATPDIQASLEFYTKLGFSQAEVGEAWPHPYAVVTDGRICLGLHQAAAACAVADLRQAGSAQASGRARAQLGLEFEFRRLGNDVFNEIGWLDPSGH